ncbi:hypothetical protein ACFU3J_08495 [Streptomyces sp. NPDC057411]
MKFLTRAISALSLVAAVLALGATTASADEATAPDVTASTVYPASLNWD